MPTEKRIVYLDQNKWIDIARLLRNPSQNPSLFNVIAEAIREINDDRLILPLSAANIYETYKISDTRRRHWLAEIQARLSKGLVFRNRRWRLESELSEWFRHSWGLRAELRQDDWFLSNVWVEAFTETSHERLDHPLLQSAIDLTQRYPIASLKSYLCDGAWEERRSPITHFSKGVDELRERIEARRRRFRDDPRSLRRRQYSAILVMDNIDTILRVAEAIESRRRTISAIGGDTFRRIIERVPTFDVESEIVPRLETEPRAIKENDFRDMHGFCAAVPYAHTVIAEKHFTSLAIQAGLHERYSTNITRSLNEILS